MEIIRQPQPKRVQGSNWWKQFAHKAKYRASGGVGDQATRTSPIANLQLVERRVDVARVNWPGLIGVQISSGMYDPRPRLIKRAQ